MILNYSLSNIYLGMGLNFEQKKLLFNLMYKIIAIIYKNQSIMYKCYKKNFYYSLRLNLQSQSIQYKI
jgi:hypothetical protein